MIKNLSLKSKTRNAFVLFAVFFMLCGVSHNLYAHALNENYVWLNVENDHLLGRFEVNINDIEKYLDISVDEQATDRKQAVEKSAAQVQAYFDKHFSISENGNKINILWSQTDVFEENPDFLQYWFKSNYVPDSPISIKNTLFLDPEHPNYDRLHRSVLVVEYNKKTGKEFGFENSVLVFSNKRTESDIDLNNPTTILSWKDFLWQGVLHILIGLDHVLFLIVLLLTTVLKVESGKWRGLTSFKPAFINTIKIVTLFTIAHSITLTLAALQLVNINIAFIESVIAFSIIAISINNLFPKYNTHAWIMVFVFGLFHGLGFASVMGDLQFRTVLIERILIMFNVGVELGQLAIVIVVFPILYWLRNSQYYYRFILVPLSLLAIIIASYWVMQRTGLIG